MRQWNNKQGARSQRVPNSFYRGFLFAAPISIAIWALLIDGAVHLYAAI